MLLVSQKIISFLSIVVCLKDRNELARWYTVKGRGPARDGCGESKRKKENVEKDVEVKRNVLQAPRATRLMNEEETKETNL
jgi:hypothetical protein